MTSTTRHNARRRSPRCDSTRVQSEIHHGDGLRLAEAARSIPSLRAGRPVNPATLWRWACDGVRVSDSSRVYLEIARLGGAWVTSRAAIARLMAALNPPPDGTPAITGTEQEPAQPAPGEARASRARQAAQAQDELRRRGI